MSAGRASWVKVAALAERLSERDKEIIRALARVRLLTGKQLERLLFHHHSIQHQSHIRRRVLKRLVDLEIVATLERRVGGVRAGSSGLVDCLGRMGQRMADILNGITASGRTRAPRTPGAMFLGHTLAVSEAFVSLVELSRQTTNRLRTFLAEPHCWWPDGRGGFLRPDAMVVVEDEHYDATVWLEIDQGTESLSRIQAKVATYEGFALTGTEGANGVLPHVLFAAMGDQRRAAIAREIANQGPLRMTYKATTQAQLAINVFQELQP
jgi:hypothetical protein